MGAESAGKQLHIDPRTIRKWMGQAGAPPELDGDAGTWQRLFELALARTEAALASGKLSATATPRSPGLPSVTSRRCVTGQHHLSRR